MPAGSPLADFVTGFRAPVAGFRHMRAHPGLWKYAVWPVVINLVVTTVVLGLLIAAGVWFAHRIHPWFVERYGGSAWGVTLEVATAAGLLIVALTAAFVAWVLLGNILGGHFNSLLARQVELQLGLPADRMRDVPFRYQVVDGLRDLGTLLAINAGLFLLNFIPFIGSAVAFPLGVYLDGWVLGYDVMDLPMELRGMRRSDKRALARQHRWQTVGVGSAVFLLNFVPVIGSILLATAATGAVLLHRQWVGEPTESDVGHLV